MALFTFLIFSVLISLGISQADIEISTQQVSNALENLEIKLVTWVDGAVDSLSQNANYTDEIVTALFMNSISDLPIFLQRLGSVVLGCPVTSVIKQACANGNLNCNDGTNVLTLNIVAEGTGASATCIVVEDKVSITDVAIFAFDESLCTGSDILTVIGADSLQPEALVANFGGLGFLLCPFFQDCALYIYDASQNVLNFNTTVARAK